MPNSRSLACRVKERCAAPLSECQDQHPVAHTLSPFGSLDELRSLITAFGFMYLPADDLAAVEVNDGEEVEERPSHRARQVSRRL
jgi:hypothetical protein